MMGFHFADDAKYWERLWSVRFLIIGTAFNGAASVTWALGYVPWMQQHQIYLISIAMVINVLALTSRLTAQPKVPCA
jgi:hypothetical protein